MRRAHVPTELPFCMPPLVVGLAKKKKESSITGEVGVNYTMFSNLVSTQLVVVAHVGVSLYQLTFFLSLSLTALSNCFSKGVSSRLQVYYWYSRTRIIEPNSPSNNFKILTEIDCVLTAFWVSTVNTVIFWGGGGGGRGGCTYRLTEFDCTGFRGVQPPSLPSLKKMLLCAYYTCFFKGTFMGMNMHGKHVLFQWAFVTRSPLLCACVCVGVPARPTHRQFDAPRRLNCCYPTTNGGRQNGKLSRNTHALHARFLHVPRRLACSVGAYQQKFSLRSSVGSFLFTRVLRGTCHHTCSGLWCVVCWSGNGRRRRRRIMPAPPPRFFRVLIATCDFLFLLSPSNIVD